MTNPEPNYEEMAALHALGLLEEAGTIQLYEAAGRYPDVRRLMDAFDETAAHLALEPMEKAPPPELRGEILAALPPAKGKVLHFSQWFPYAIAACLMILAISQATQLTRLTRTANDLRQREIALNDESARLRASNELMSLQLATLDAKDPAYGAVKIVVAWDSNRRHGAVAVENLPPAPAGKDYQLWVLDPNAPSPLSAGVLVASRSFDAPRASVPKPGFAISLEPSGGSASPTGPILFAVAPAE